MEDYHKYGYTKDGKVYLKGYLEHPDREIGVVKATEEESLKYFADRYDQLMEKIDTMEKDIEVSQNKGSYLMKLIHLQDSLHEYNAIGDFPEVLNRLERMQHFINAYIAENRVKNLEIKQALLQEARDLTNPSEQEWEEAAEALKELKMRWIRTGSTHDEEALCTEFDNLLDDFFERRKSYYEELKDLTQRRMGQYRNLIRALKDINIKGENNSEARKKVIEVQRDWKAVGRINKWHYLKLWKKYKREIDIFFGNEIQEENEDTYARPSRNFQQRPERRPRESVVGTRTTTTPANNFAERPPKRRPLDVKSMTTEDILARKKELCEDVKQILDGNIHNVSLDAIKERQMEWRTLGIVQQNDEDKAFNIEFRSVCNEIFEHYNLYKTVRNKVEGFVQKTRFEQLKIKIKLLKDIIKEEENELSRMTPPDPNNRDPRDKSRLKYINKINKIKTQKRMLRKMQRELNSDFY